MEEDIRTSTSLGECLAIELTPNNGVCVCLVGEDREGDREKGVVRVERAFVHITWAATLCVCIPSLGLPPIGSLHSPACIL